MLLFKSGITVYIPLFISRAWSSNKKNTQKTFASPAKTAAGRNKQEKQMQSFLS